jgi:GT2 family glycosyltransferase
MQTEHQRPDSRVSGSSFFRRLARSFRHRRREHPNVDVVRRTELFDAAWYLATYPDAASSSGDPAVHYLRKGAARGYNPGPDFDGEWYLQHYPDVVRLAVNPLVHYVLHGRAEGRLPCNEYKVWLKLHKHSQDDIERMKRESAQFAFRPRISIVMPIYNPDRSWLDEAVASVRAQYYENWQLCLADDCSSDAEVRAWMQQFVAADSRIVATYLPRNSGISAASNAALGLADGEFVTFLDNDDELKPNALHEVVRRLNADPELDLIYSDEDKKDPEGNLCQPFFKPDWSPDLLMSNNYICHLAVYRRALVATVGGLRSVCDCSQDYDLVLRATEQTRRIAHVPLPLYTWRMVPGSTSMVADAKPQSQRASLVALSDALGRRNLDAQVETGIWYGSFRVRYAIPAGALVSIIIPTRDRLDLLRTCIDSIRARSRYANYEIIVADNGSTEQATCDYLAALVRNGTARVVDASGPFNFSVINNSAARHARGQHLLFLNNDIEVTGGEWLEAMLEHSARPDVGAVGARLLYGDGRVQHAGVVLGIGDVAENAFRLMGEQDHGYFGRANSIQNYSAVTAACLMMRKDVFDRVGGFDEDNLAVAFGDVDLCLRVRAMDYLVVYTPFAELFHHESASRGSDNTPEKAARFERERGYMLCRWGPLLRNDPYYNPNLTLRGSNFGLRLHA